MNIPFKIIEKATGKKVKPNFASFGADIASRSGFCKMISNKKNILIEYQFVEFDKTTPKAKYSTMVETFEKIITPDIKKAIIEDTHLQYFRNPVTKRLQPQVNVLKQLTRFGGFAISKCVREKIKYDTIGATKSRATFGIKCKKGKAKESVALWLNKNLGIDLKGDNDCSDAVVLALIGITR